MVSMHMTHTCGYRTITTVDVYNEPSLWDLGILSITSKIQKTVDGIKVNCHDLSKESSRLPTQ